MKTIMKDQSGMALIVTLLIVVVLTVSVTEYLHASWMDRARASLFRDGMRATVAVTSGLRAAEEILREDYRMDRQTGKMVDSLDEVWAQEFPIPIGNDMAVIKITDESGKLDINRLVTNTDEVDEKWMEVFERLLNNLGLDPYIADAVVDWLDVNRDGLHENGYYMALTDPYPCKNGKMDSIEELKRVRYVTPEAYRMLAPYLTVRSSGRINVNTAPPELLRALHKDMSGNAAAEILNARGIAPFTQLGELKDIPALADLYVDISPMVTVNSNSFTAAVTVRIGEVTRTGEALYGDRTEAGATLYYQRVS